MKFALNLAALFALVLGTGLAGCGIGEGSTIEKLEIIPASDITQLKSFEIGDDYKLFQCLRDELLVRATFTDGTQSNFAARATWSSSDPAVVQVSNGDIAAVLSTGSTDGSWLVADTLKYGPGTVIPVGTPGQTAVITATFASLSASIQVEIRKPTLRLVPAPDPDPEAAVPPFYLAQRTTQRLNVLANLDGKRVRGVDLAGGTSNNVNINPFRFVFTGGTFIPQDPDVDDDVDLWVVNNAAGTDRAASMITTTTDGFIEGVVADYAPHEVAAETYLCQASADPALLPVADIQVATFYEDPLTAEDDGLVLSREAGFNGSGFLPQDLVVGSNQKLELRGRLDANGDGSLIVDQNLSNQTSFMVQPLDTSCQNEAELLGCSSNSNFVVSTGLLGTTTLAEEGDTARIRGCYPLCLRPVASLEADDATVGTGVTVNFTATATNPPSDVPVINYLFDFGDGTTVGPQASAMASHAYATAGFYTATVRLVDPAFPAEALSPNLGAVRVLAGVNPPANNTAPNAVLTIATEGEEAPKTVIFTATNSNDADTGDSITAYEFDPGDGTPVIRQSASLFSHTYLDGTGSPFTPTLKVYDESGVASTVVNGTAVTVTGTAPPLLRSNAFDLRARKATLCSVELQPVPGATPTEEAFTFPGLRFQAMGSFVANTDTDTCADPVIGTQLMTRFVSWTLRPAGVTDDVSDIVSLVFSQTDYQFPGQTSYFNDVAVPTVVDVTAATVSPFADDDDDVVDIPVAPTTLTVTPCTTCGP